MGADRTGRELQEHSSLFAASVSRRPYITKLERRFERRSGFELRDGLRPSGVPIF